MPYHIYQYDEDKTYNDKLMDILQKRKVQLIDIKVVWQLAFDYIASQGKAKIPEHEFLKVTGVYSKNGPINVCPQGVFYTAKIIVFNELVQFEYNKTLKRVSYRYLISKN